ncbi:general secretion pathway protein GspB [Marinobacter sp. BGYM27]|uniref:general secretion pathway protein GspB n=1 Tax=unclassified Marinobacter TaxID=83889 RepID=UPI0021A3380B|nr:general secretion pathway protein GspB [Marinobacter sp. BGYM27]MDG5499059.1 general secretion pathway protein GspB [Marinobacter sp. BGYM27]
MSYILDALRKSESERQQGRVPDLNQSVQMVHKPRRKGIPVAWWLAVALFFNGAIVALVFWPGAGLQSDSAEGEVQPAAQTSTPNAQPDGASVAQNSPPDAPASEQEPTSAKRTAGSQDFKPIPTVPVDSAQKDNSEAANPPMKEAVVLAEQPTLIVPTRSSASNDSALPDTAYQQDREYDGVPHLIEMPLSFQRQIPSLRFNSHIYASDPAARRVIINDKYLRAGDSFSGIRVVAITSDGVILSRIGTEFRVGVVRDWVTPR